MTEKKKFIEEALKIVHSFLNHPMKAGRLYATYDKEATKSALKVLHDIIQKLESRE